MKHKNTTCGTCLFHARDKVFAQPCASLGKVSSSVTCGSFTPNGFDLATIDSMDGLEMISKAMADLKGKDLRTLGAILMQEEQSRKNGYSFFQKIYLRIQGGYGQNYLGNFVTARVLTADKEWVRIISESGKVCVTVMNEPESGTIYDAKRFAPIREQMFKSGKFIDPSVNLVIKERPHMEGVPTLDDANKVGALDRLPGKRRLKKSDKTDLERFVARMSRGFALPERTAPTSGDLTFDYGSKD